MLNRKVRFVVALLALLGLAACGGVGPTPISTDNVKPAPAGGTTDHQVPIVGEAFPLHVWLTEVSPPQGSTLQVGQIVRVRFTCGGPSGTSYVALIGAELMAGEYIAETVQNGNPTKVDRIGGSIFRIGDKCDTVAGVGFTIKVTAPEITHVLFQVWVGVPKTGPPDFGRPDQSGPPGVFQEPLNWLAPVQ